MSRFRLPRPVLLELCAELRPALERNTARSAGLSVPTQVLTTLGFLATGAFQRELADRSGVCQSTLSRAMPAVWDGIIRMSSRTWLLTPLTNPGTEQERRYNDLHSRTRALVERAISWLSWHSHSHFFFWCLSLTRGYHIIQILFIVYSSSDSVKLHFFPLLMV
ncbi:putative nuclease HARBI1 [Sparus aurata]|uniref:putative nuclease HARBI1 n=1 Tax=Sparus aurata TaxID=8175 RepID=UPI0011C10E19|nr:putative nuclease HARBI1 [Sparus aurata]